ncbi:MAG: hypothetical protein PHT88_00580 [Candidatus Moranbacteria bacterium]|nr:hypothetical protein [Candidatus Moranbacteria bacterium]
MTRAITKNDAISHPFTLTAHDKKAVYLYGLTEGTKTRIFIAQSHDGLDFSKASEIEIVSGKRSVALKNCDVRSFFAYGGVYYLAYVHTVRGRGYMMIAQSEDMRRFEVIKKDVDLPSNAACIISSYKHKKRFLSYYGDRSIAVTASSDLVSWHTSGELLSPRKGHFDDGALRVIGTLLIDQGILVLYESKSKKATRTVKVGAALFSLDKPYMPPLWRSDAPIWEEVIGKKDYPERFLGAVIIEHALHIYWVSAEGEVIAKSINLVSSGLVRAKVIRQLKRHHKNPIIEPKLDSVWEKEATFNPAALHLDGKIHLLYRAIGENGMSVLGYASSEDGFTISERLDRPVFTLVHPFEGAQRNTLPASSYVSGGSWAGCEDPRLTHIGNRIYMTYVLFDGHHAPGVALTSIGVKDFLKKNWKWKKPVLISKPGEIQKNWMIFPEKINGRYAVLHSITPKISIEYIDSLDDEKLVIESMKMPGVDEHRWDNIVRGAGAPPLMTKYGWLVLYHAMDKRDPNRYKVGAMILDHHNPAKILHRCTYPILEPSAAYENHGAKSGVVYVCGAVIKEDTLFVYYGGADSVVCVATENIDEFLGDLTKQIEYKTNKPSPPKKINKPKQK